MEVCWLFVLTNSHECITDCQGGGNKDGSLVRKIYSLTKEGFHLYNPLQIKQILRSEIDQMNQHRFLWKNIASNFWQKKDMNSTKYHFVFSGFKSETNPVRTLSQILVKMNFLRKVQRNLPS